VGEVSERFRKRARECRELALRARDEQIRLHLIEVAGDLEIEAAKLDEEDQEEAARRKLGDAEPL
jgi:hypothetical protein